MSVKKIRLQNSNLSNLSNLKSLEILTKKKKKLACKSKRFALYSHALSVNVIRNPRTFISKLGYIICIVVKSLFSLLNTHFLYFNILYYILFLNSKSAVTILYIYEHDILIIIWQEGNHWPLRLLSTNHIWKSWEMEV